MATAASTIIEPAPSGAVTPHQTWSLTAADWCVASLRTALADRPSHQALLDEALARARHLADVQTGSQLDIEASSWRWRLRDATVDVALSAREVDGD